jgi:hypothetical protein
MGEPRSTREALTALALEEVQGAIDQLEAVTEKVADLQRAVPLAVDSGVSQIRQAAQAAADANRKAIKQASHDLINELNLVRGSAKDLLFTQSERVKRQVIGVGVVVVCLALVAGAVGGYVGTKYAQSAQAETPAEK